MRAGDVVSLRVRTASGPTDVVGTLVAAQPETLTIRRRDGSLTTVAVADVEAGRVVPPGPARTVSVGELGAVMAQGWRALETAELGGWLVRAGGGFTGRANSALVPPDPVPDLPDRLRQVRQWYAARDLPAMLQLTIGSEPPGLLARIDGEGWQSTRPTHVMTAELAPILRAATEQATGHADEVRLEDAPDDAWLAAFRADQQPLPPAARSVLTNHPQVAFASIRDSAGCRAIARVAIDGRWAGLHAVEVDPAHRRTGLATGVVVGALRWAVQRGARRSYLQVFSDNTAATALWLRLGYLPHHDYVYRTAVEPTTG